MDKLYRQGYNDHRKANSDPDLLPKDVEKILKAKGPAYAKGWEACGENKYTEDQSNLNKKRDRKDRKPSSRPKDRDHR